MRRVSFWVLVVAVVSLSRTAGAAFHLWELHEIYTDSSGSRQFIELFSHDSGQQFTGGQQIAITPAGGGAPHVFTIPSNLPGDTANRSLLLSTALADASGAPTPDFVIPENLLFPGGGTISFFGSNGGSYTALPTDGVQSRIWGDGNAVNSPQNYAGQVGLVVVPEPAAVSLLGVGALGLLKRRRRA